MSRQTLLAALGALLAVSTPTHADEAGETFDTPLVLGPTVRSVETQLLLDGEDTFAPDLLLGVYDEFGELIDTDSDSSFFGDGFAPGYFDAPILPGGEILFDITGEGDDGFFGDHSESGDYEVYLDIFDSGGNFLDAFVFEAFLESGFVDGYSEIDPSWEGGTYNIDVNNAIPNDVDFFRFTGLTPGEPFIAETREPSFPDQLVDTLLGWFDDAGNLLASDDFSGDGLFSRLDGTVPPSGEVLLGVTGFQDAFFDGAHPQFGSYELLLTEGVAILAGDYDDDGDVDTDDYAVWEAAYGRFGIDEPADANGDGRVDAADYTVWRDASAAVAAQVPEPAAGLLAALGLLASQRRHRA